MWFSFGCPCFFILVKALPFSRLSIGLFPMCAHQFHIKPLINLSIYNQMFQYFKQKSCLMSSCLSVLCFLPLCFLVFLVFVNMYYLCLRLSASALTHAIDNGLISYSKCHTKSCVQLIHLFLYNPTFPSSQILVLVRSSASDLDLSKNCRISIEKNFHALLNAFNDAVSHNTNQLPEQLIRVSFSSSHELLRNSANLCP